MTAILPSGDWRIQRDASGQLLPRTHQFVSPDGTTYISATQGFVDGVTSWGVKSSDLIRTFGLTPAQPGQRIYFTAEAQMQTWSALRGRRRFARRRPALREPGRGRRDDRCEGPCYLAAGDVYVYRPDGTLLRTIKVPERPLQVVLVDQTDARCSCLRGTDSMRCICNDECRLTNDDWPPGKRDRNSA